MRRRGPGTAESVEEHLKRRAESNVERAAREGGPAVDARIGALAEEWDLERALVAHAAGAALVGLGLSLTVDRRFLALPALAAAFLLQHALLGWSPPLPLLRRFGLRTLAEIELERYALKALRGDFCAIRPGRAEGASRALEAAR